MAKQQYCIKVDPELLAQLRALAYEDRTTVTALFERGAAALLNPVQETPAAPAMPPRRKVGGVPTEPSIAVAVAAICSRCLHETRKHTPACYVVGCLCRRVVK